MNKNKRFQHLQRFLYKKVSNFRKLPKEVKEILKFDKKIYLQFFWFYNEIFENKFYNVNILIN